jgi:hypothetical protein
MSAYADVKPSADSCFYTSYDGVGDAFYSDDASLKLTVPFAYCVELRHTTLASDGGFIGNTEFTAGFGGAGMAVFGSIGGLVNMTVHPTSVTQIGLNTAAVITSSTPWYKVVLNYDGSTVKIFVDGVEKLSSAMTTYAASAEHFYIGRMGTSYQPNYTGDLRNVEYYSGTITNPEAWVPGDTSSLTGSTLLVQSADGGTTIDTGPAFVTVGDPTRSEC